MATMLSANIRELRNALGLTQSELAGKLYKAGSTVRMWELGKASPDAETLVALSQIFNVSVDYLLSNTITSTGTSEKTSEHNPKISSQDRQIVKISKELTHLNLKQLKLVNELVREISRDNQ